MNLIFQVVVVISLILFLAPPSIHGTEYYAFRLSGSDCVLCHIDPKSGTLTRTGTLFQEGGYIYPSSWEQAFFWVLGGLTFLLVFHGVYRRYRLWRLGRSDVRWDRLRERGKGLFLYVLAHGTVLRSLFPGVSHLLLFWSILVLAIAVGVVLFQEYLMLPLLSLRVISPKIYPWFRLLLDFFGVMGLIGTILLTYRRYIQGPRELDHQRTDALSLGFLVFIFITGFGLTGIRNQLYRSSWSPWAPSASIMASILTAFVKGEGRLEIWFSALWWAHIFLSLSFLAYLPFSRLLHLFSAPLSIFFRDMNPKGTLPAIDLESSEVYGAGKIEEFTWKHLLELDACTRCGRCQESCPAYLTQKHLNPKRVVQNLKKHMESLPAARKEVQLIKEVVTENEIWECTTCRNCLEHCPVFIEPMVKLIELRRNLVLHHGKIPRETFFAFRNIERKGNPWGFDPEKRMGWTKELGVREVSPGDEVDILFWVGCYDSYDDRNIRVGTSLVNILNRAGLDFGVLGNGEWCCGTDLRRMGSEYQFQLTVERNADLLRQVKFRRILTTCPHCFNTLKNEYPQFGATFDVIHYTTLVDDLIQQGKIETREQGRSRRITYHDSCYLGRYNGGFDPPRKILSSLSDFTLVEMDRNREKAFCCGGGGCHMWMEERTGRRINETRVAEAARTGAEIIATVCPLCMISLDSAIKVLNLDERIQVMDILELVNERLSLE